MPRTAAPEPAAAGARGSLRHHPPLAEDPPMSRHSLAARPSVTRCREFPRRRSACVLWLVGLLLCLPAMLPAPGVAASHPQRQPAPPVSGQVDTTWTFDVSSQGQDIHWTSPTAVDPTMTDYVVTFTIDRVDVMVSFLGIPFGPFDATEQIPPDQLSNTGHVPGPAPVTVLDAPVVAPPPPEPLAVGATLGVALDAGGFGTLSATGVTLGTVQVPLGFPFGTVTANITSIRIAGSVAVAQHRWLVTPL